MTRTLIVGDVHGCLAELRALLAIASIDRRDRVVFVGDLVGRGPDTKGVLNLVRELNAQAVQGNHERKLLQAYAVEGNVGEKLKLGAGHRQLMRELNPEDWALLRAMPLYLFLPQHQACVVHAGVLPGRPILAQDPWVVTHIRSIDERGQPNSEVGKQSWAAVYKGPPHIIFGHSAQVGLQMYEYATGLDSACVYGGRLTGLLLDEGQPVPAVNQRPNALVSVPAGAVYCQPRP